MLITPLALVCAVIGVALIVVAGLSLWEEGRRRRQLMWDFNEAEAFEDKLERNPPKTPAGVAGAGGEPTALVEKRRLRGRLVRAREQARALALLPRTPPFVLVFAAALFLLIAAGLAVADEGLSAGQKREAQPLAVISYVDVGQGDGVVMRVGKKIIVSDAGELNPQSVDAALRKVGAAKIDVAILTHPHKDHVKNFLDLLEIYQWPIKTAVLSHSAHWEATKNNRLLIEKLSEHGVKLVYATTGDHFSWGGASWDVLSPPADRYTADSQAANSSIVYVLRLKGREFLFTGDIGSPVAKEVAQLWTSKHLGRADVFLATHHGSAGGSTNELLTAIDPTWAVLSTGPNTYKHPTQAAIDRLEEAGASIWCTAVNGTVTARVASSGKLSWQASGQSEPWWSAAKKRETGLCVGH